MEGGGSGAGGGELGETNPIVGERIEGGGVDCDSAVAMEIAVANRIGDDENEIRSADWFVCFVGTGGDGAGFVILVDGDGFDGGVGRDLERGEIRLGIAGGGGSVEGVEKIDVGRWAVEGDLGLRTDERDVW